jgi:4-diphosphocytidyl-2C-methyl-D-erythritol kinase
VCRQAVNVFEVATELDGVRDIRRRMEQYNPLCSQMTGSGSCVFAIFADEDAAEACLADLQTAYPTAFICYPCNGIV